MRTLSLVALLIALAAPALAQEPAPAPAPTAAQPSPAAAPQAAPTPDWIRPEAVPAQADALLAQVEAGRLDAAKQARVAAIEKSLTDITPRLDQLSARVQTALGDSAQLDKLDEIAREISSAAASLDKWQETLEAEA